MNRVTAVVFEVPASEAELVADALWALGVAAVEERDDDTTGTQDRMVELWTSLGPDHGSITTALEGFPARWRWRLVDLDGEVVHTWRAFARPIWVQDDLVIVPAWYEGSLGGVSSDVERLTIDPGEAFGMGDHPTTLASLRSLRAAVFPNSTVLDVGCGSGILGIAALRFGSVRAEAIDIAGVAVRATTANAAANGVAGRLSSSTIPLAEVEGTFDVVVANILAPTLIDMAPDLRRVMEPDGVLIVSGLLAERHQHVVEALAPLRLVHTELCESWVALTLRW